MEKKWYQLFGLLAVILILGSFVLWASSLPKSPGQSGDVLVEFVSGTEYNVNEHGQVIVEARYPNSSSALGNGSCQLIVWYPDKSLFLNQTGLLSASGSNYITFIIPNITGVYEYQAQCALLGGREGIISKSFHVSEFQNDTFTKLNRVRAVIPK